MTMTSTERRVWTPDGDTWVWNMSSSRWECQCRHCKDNPAEAQDATFADLVAAYEFLSDWSPSDAIEMAEEKQTSAMVRL